MVTLLVSATVFALAVGVLLAAANRGDAGSAAVGVQTSGAEATLGLPQAVDGAEGDVGAVAPELAIPQFEVDADGRSFGRVPEPDGKTPDEIVDASPDFIAVLTQDGTDVAGFVEKTAMFRPNLSGTPLDVVARDGETVVGKWVPGIGFVPLGEGAE